MKRCKNHQYGGSLVVPGLRLVRNNLRRRMKGMKFGLRLPVPHNEDQETSC